MLDVSGIVKRFGATTALDGVDFSVRAGEVHALVGENGAGKSTLMNVLSGAMRPDAGTMRIDGRPYTPASALDARRSGITLIHQELSLAPHLTVSENILLGTEVSRWGWIDRAESRRRSVALLERLEHAEIDPDARVADLSLPAQQVVEICRALAADTRIVLMDEPTSRFQREDVERLFRLVRHLASRGIAVVYISHFLEEVREIADRYTVLRDGRTVDAGTLAATTDEHIVAQMVGREMARLFPERPARTLGDVVLSVTDLAAPPGLVHASFELLRGEILGIAGLVGSGRTELVRALFGLGGVTSGQIVIGGRPVDARRGKPAARLREGLGYVSEDRKGEGLALPLSVADNLTATRLAAFTRGGWLDLDAQRDGARRWMDALSIRARSPDDAVRTLSGGNQQKVAIGRLLHQDAEVLLLDEPSRGIDIGSKAQVYEIISRCADEGKAVLVVSSYLPELFELCDRLAVMHRGRLSPARPVAEWTPESVLEAAITAAQG
ncbi:MAG TPA: sugar ABC transporter ATP-binding protein [Gemmatimonadaceae bacterium]|nr:sugar ABC transporter ATP-binding protein [Gemmatimonadaceae bacterium]